MKKTLHNNVYRNFALAGLVATTMLFTAHNEGYLGMISLPLWGVLAGGFALFVWLAQTASTARMLSLIVTIFTIEYIKEAIGIRYGLWIYHGINGAFVFGVWAWVLAGISCYVLATKVITPGLRRLSFAWTGRINPLIMIGFAAFGLVLLGGRAGDMGWLFWVLYALLVIFTVIRSLSVDFLTLVGLVITSWIVGNASEYVGSVASGVWTFPLNPDYPPMFLLFACWPIEIVAQYLLAKLLVPASSSKASLIAKGEER